MIEPNKLRCVIRAIHPRRLFRISRAARAGVENVFVKVTRDGISGFGEASPNSFYDETAHDVLNRVQSAAPLVAGLNLETVADIEQAWHALWPWVAPSRAAQCAVDLALWDWLARRKGTSVAELATGKPPRPVKTFCTIGISEPAELEEKIAEMRGFPLIKLKADERADLNVIRQVHERTGAVLAVDANCAWDKVDLAAISIELAKHGVVFIEQPLHPDEDERMTTATAASQLPFFADESCVALEDIERLPGRFAGFNIKLVKCGGLTPAFAMLRRGRELGLRTMVGCMLESSLLIAAGTVIAQQTEYADLDGAWLLNDDPFTGLPLREGILIPNAEPGFGVIPAGMEF